MEDLKTFGAVELALGLLSVSLSSLLLQVETLFKKKETLVVVVTGAWIIISGLFLVCGGRKPTACCVKYNVTIHLVMLVFSAGTFCAMVRHVPYRHSRYCSDSSCYSGNSETMVLVGGILAVLLTVFLVEALISLAVVLTSLCSMAADDPQQPQDPECIGSTTSEPLWPPPQKPGDPEDDSVKTDC